MKFKVKLTEVSEARKLGPMAASITSANSCPSACPLKNGGGCYAETGPISWIWRGVTAGTRGGTLGWDEFCEALADLPRKRKFRHNMAGDLPGDGEILDREKCLQLAEAAAHLRSYSYTHYPASEENLGVLRGMVAKGFGINLSADNLQEADEVSGKGVPVVVLLPAGQKENTKTPEGRDVVVCPHYTRGVVCCDCMLCAVTDRKVIVGFPAHGARKAKVTKIANNLTGETK